MDDSSSLNSIDRWANPVEPLSGTRTAVQPKTRCSIGCWDHGKTTLDGDRMTESIHPQPANSSQATSQRARTVECPACLYRFEVYEYRRNRPRSKAYKELLVHGLSSRELAEDTGLTRQQVTNALGGRIPFSVELWTELAHRLGAHKANRIRYIAFRDRRRYRNQSLDRPTEPPLAVLWDVGLTPPQLGWHARINPKTAAEEILGERSLSTGLAETLLRLAGQRVLEQLEEIHGSWQ